MTGSETPVPLSEPAAPTRGLGHRALGGLVWMLSSAAAQSIFRIVFLMVVARVLGPTEFGVAAAAMVVVSMALAVTQLGLSTAIVQRPKLDERHERTAFTLAIIVSILSCALLQVLAPYAALFFRFEELTDVLRALAPVVVLSNIGLVADGLTRRNCKFRRLATVTATSFGIGFGVVGIALALLGAGVWALVGANLAQHAVRSAILLRLQPHQKTPSLELSALKELIYFGGGMTVWRIGSVAAFQLDNLVVGRWLGADMLGLYGRAYQLMSMPAAIFGQAMMHVIFPLMSQVQDQPARVGLAFRRGSAGVALLALPTAMFVMILAPELVMVVLGSRWGGVVEPLQILAVGVVFRLSHRLSESVTNALGAVYATGLRQGFYAAMVFLGALIGQAWGLQGVAVGVLIALAIHFVLMVDLCIDLTAMSWRAFLLALLPAVMMTAVLGCETWLLSEFLRSHEMPPLMLLLICVGTLGGTVLVILASAGKALLGEDGRWLLQAIVARLKKSSADAT